MFLCWRHHDPCAGFILNMAILRGLIAATGLLILLKSDPNCRFFRFVRSFRCYAPGMYVSYQSHLWIQIGVIVWICLNRSQILNLSIVWTCNLLDDPEKTIWHLFHAPKSHVSNFIAIREFKLEITSGNAQIRAKSSSLKFDGWPSKPIGHIFYATPSCVHHFLAIGEFNMELQSGNAKCGSNLAIFCPVWPWNLTDDLENNRAPILCHIKPCVSFRSYLWIQTGITTRKCHK